MASRRFLAGSTDPYPGHSPPLYPASDERKESPHEARRNTRLSPHPHPPSHRSRRDLRLQQEGRHRPQLRLGHQQLLQRPPRLPLQQLHELPQAGRHLRLREDLAARLARRRRVSSPAPPPRRRSSSSPRSKSTTTIYPTKAAPPGPPIRSSPDTATSATAIAR